MMVDSYKLPQRPVTTIVLELLVGQSVVDGLTSKEFLM
jgi:hypothetical protein